jgi:hypothetical protein
MLTLQLSRGFCLLYSQGNLMSLESLNFLDALKLAKSF